MSIGYTPDKFPVIYDESERQLYYQNNGQQAINSVVSSFSSLTGSPIDNTSLSTRLGQQQVADYVITKSGSTITATARIGSGFSDYSGTDAYTVIQNAINALTPSGTPGTGGGKIVINQGRYSLSNELTITGWENQGLGNRPTSMLSIEGVGKATYIYQGTPNKNGIIIKNNASVSITNMRIECDNNCRSALRFDAGGTDEVSVFGGKFDNLHLTSYSATYPAMYLQNFFYCHFGYITAGNSIGDAIVWENASTTILYGNSHFDYIWAYASSSSPYAGLKIKSTDGGNYHAIDLTSISNFECINGYYGVHITDASSIVFNFVDIENTTVGFHIGGGTLSRGIKVLGGSIGTSASNGKCLELIANAGGNSFACELSGATTATPIYDIQTFMPPNAYDVVLPNDNSANINITQASRTHLRYRAASTGRTYNNFGDNAIATTQSVGDNSTAVATTAYADNAAEENQVLFLQGMGSDIKALTLGVPLGAASSTMTPVVGNIFLIPVYLRMPATLTGVKFILQTAGVYTANNENRIGLYTESGGTLTLVASSANNGTLWTATANTLVSAPFSSTYAASKGKYFIGIMYNNSAETTAPKLFACSNYNNNVWGAIVASSANSNRLYGNKAASTLPSSFAASTLGQPTSAVPLLMLY